MTPSAPTGRYESGCEAELLQIVLDHLDVGISVLDEDLRYRLIAGKVYDQLGITPEELPVGSRLSDCHALMQERGLLNPDTMRDQRLSESEQRARAASGQTEASRLVHLGDGSVHRFHRKSLPTGETVSIASDVTDLVEKEHMLQNALKLGNAGYWTYEFATKTYSLSNSFAEYLGPEQAELVRRNGIIHCVHPDDRDHFHGALRALRDGQNRFTADCRTRPFNGKVRWSRTTAELVRDPHGRALRLRAFVRDITEMRRKERELERAKDEAIAASHAKSEFLANMSHEIRTPMNGVLGMAELLAATVTDERQREYVNVINSSASALLNIINDILDFSKIEAGALEIDPMPFNLRDCVSDVTALLVTAAQEKGLELIIDYPEDLPRHFVGDAGRLRQVLTNLVGNAIKFTECGHVSIRVGVTTREAAPGKSVGVVSLDVTDTGIGIAPEKRRHVFDKFTQADGSTTRVYGGTGLGLTITKRIVEMMNGRIAVQSELGEGSTFSVRLPLPIDTTARRETLDTTQLAGLRALIVDDISVNCTVLRRQLAGWSMESDCAHNAVDAVEAVRRAAAEGQPYDLILLDYLMPGMNGRELASMLHMRPDIAMPPTLMLSSCDQPVASRDLATIGIDSYLVKPVRERRLYDTVVRVMSARANTPVAVELQVQTAPPAAPVIAADVPTPESVASAPVASAPETPTAPQPIIKPATEPSSARQDILVAEDFALNQDVVRLMLQNSPFNPVFAENGRVAVDMFTAEPDRFPLILMDVSMPVMDGHSATREIREWERSQGRKPVPVIALTGHAMKSDKQDCVDAGMDDFLTKPVKQLALLEKLERHSQRVVHATTRAA